MSQRWLTTAAVLALGCGPQAGVPGTAADGAASSDATTAATSGGTTSVSTAQSDTAASVTDGSTAGASTDGGSSTTTGAPEGCCDGVPIPVDQAVAEGFIAADILQQIATEFVDVPIAWNTASPASTTATLEPYFVMQVLDIPGDERCCPCGFLYVPCEGGLQIELMMGVDTADGWVVGAELVAHVAVGYSLGDTTYPPFGQIRTDALALADVEGALKDQMFQTRDGEPIVPTEVRILAGWSPEDLAAPAGVIVESDAGLLGEPPTP